MITLNEQQYKKLTLAVNLIIKRKREVELSVDINLGASAIVTAKSLVTEFKLSQFRYMQVVKAIAKPNAILFFLSHDSNEENCVENLATFIENNSFDSTNF